MFKIRVPANGNYPEVVIGLHANGISVTEVNDPSVLVSHTFIWEFGELVAIDCHGDWNDGTMIWGIGAEALLQIMDVTEERLDPKYRGGDTTFVEVEMTGAVLNDRKSVVCVIDVEMIPVFARAFKALVVHQLRKVFGD